MASNDTEEEHWLDQYGSKEYEWRSTTESGRPRLYRPLGFVENSFDADGRYFEGRADMNGQLEVEVASSLSNEDFRERILFSWTCLRCKHLLLQAKTASTQELYGRASVAASRVAFCIDAPRTVTEAIEDAARHLEFLGDYFKQPDPIDFWRHCRNTARVLNPEDALGRLFVYPIEPLTDNRGILRLLTIAGHEIQDGLTAYSWTGDLIAFLNLSVPDMRNRLRELIDQNAMYKRLPLPQEALYPPILGSKARQRWFWLLTRILRHVRKPLQAGFENPLRRLKPRSSAIPLPPTYAPVLDYSKTPPLNAGAFFANLTSRATERIHRICREVKASVGAGCFAFTALLMMEMYERQQPDVPIDQRRPFISGFPLNPRAFFNHTVEPDSLMLCFSDGIALPFLSAEHDLDSRLRLLTRQAHRQLAAYQKRPNPKSDEADLQFMGSRGTGRILATSYIAAFERMQAITPEHLRSKVNPQGAYPMRPNHSSQTCGVSSVGRRQAFIQRNVYNLDDGEKDFVADYRDMFGGVRPRDGEFLVGIGGDYGGIYMSASIDDNAMDPELVQQWRRRFETILEEETDWSKL